MLSRIRRTSSLVVMAFCAALAVLPAAASAQAKAKPFSQLVPDDVTQFLSLTDYKAFKEKLKGTPYYALAQEPEVKALIDEAFDALSKNIVEMKEAVGFEPADIEKVLSGEIALVLIQRFPAPGGGQPGQPGRGDVWGLVLVDVGPNQPQAKEMLDRALQRAAQQEGFSVTEEQFKTHKITKLAVKRQVKQMTEEELNKLSPELREVMKEIQAKRQEEAGREQEAYISLEGATLAVGFGQDRSLLERHLVLRDGGDIQPLSASETFKAVIGQIDPLSDYVSFQSFEWVWNGIREAGGASPFMPFDAGQLMEEMGVFNLKAESAGVKIGQNGIVSQAFILAPAPRQGVLKAIVPGDKVDVKPPAFVADDAALYAGLYFDVPIFWAEFKEALKKTAPQMHQMLEMRLNDPQAPIQVERDLINSLGAHWFVYVPKEVYVAQPQDAPGEVNVVLAVELKDTAAFQRFFNQLMAMMPPDEGMKQVPFMGVTIYETPPLGDGGGPVKVSLRMMFISNMFVIATSEATAKQTIRLSKQGKSALLGKAEYKDALSQLPRRQEGIVYADHRYVGEWVYKLVDKYVPHEKVTLPQWKTLEKYLFVSAAVFSWNDKGLKATGWQPFPPAAGEGR